MTIRQTMLACLLCSLLANSVLASNIDQVYTKQIRQTWGQWFKGLFQRSDFNKSYAIVIGVSQFDSFQNLGTTNDPVRMKNYLLNEAGFDYVRLITGKQVNLNKIRSIMVDEMPRLLNPDDRLLFYWSGHGATDSVNGKQFGYLPVTNSSKSSFSSMLGMNDLSSWDSRLRAKQTLYLLDACFSGLAGYQVKSDGREQTLQQIARPSRQILTAGLANEETIVINRLGGSVFTTALLDGMRGEADTESGAFQKDGIVSARELELYVKRRVGFEVAKSGWKGSITPLLTRLNHREGDFFFFSEQTIAAAPVSSAVQMGQLRADSGVVTMSGNQQQSSSSANQKYIRLPNNLNLVSIPAGRFQMGSNRYAFDEFEKPIHTVTIPRPFWMSETEITFNQYDAYTEAVGKHKANDEGWGRGMRPVINVSWNDAKGYAEWLSRDNTRGLQCSLPSESEWEYAARAGTSTEYFWGNQASHEFANFGTDDIMNLEKGLIKGRDQWKHTAPVGQFLANPFGLKDMHGNVWEWVQDCANKSYEGAPVDGSAWISGNCQSRIWRGGSWLDGQDSVGSSKRATVLGPYSGPNFALGFRIACTSL